jgi:hypothetical protein
MLSAGNRICGSMSRVRKARNPVGARRGMAAMRIVSIKGGFAVILVQSDGHLGFNQKRLDVVSPASPGIGPAPKGLTR